MGRIIYVITLTLTTCQQSHSQSVFNAEWSDCKGGVLDARVCSYTDVKGNLKIYISMLLLLLNISTQ